MDAFTHRESEWPPGVVRIEPSAVSARALSTLTRAGIRRWGACFDKGDDDVRTEGTLTSLNTASLIRRNMKQSPTFVRCDDRAGLPVPLSLGQDEVLVGWYANPPPWETTLVIFTSLAVYVAEGGRILHRTALDEIVEYETPTDKVSVTGVRVRTADGFSFVRMAGRYGPDGKYGDVFNFIMILQVLVSRVKRAR